MKKLIISGTLCAVVALAGAQEAFAEETTTTTTTTSQTDMLAKIKDLMKLIASLQEQINTAKGEIKELAIDLDLGAQNDDVLKAQEILASDPTLFGVKPTGYFGPMTQEALKKFQERYGLEVTGKLDEPTRDVMKELRKERKEGRVPPGLIKSGEIKDRILKHLNIKWGKHDSDDDMDDSDDEDESEDDSDDSDATRAEAKAAIAAAQDDIAEFRITIDDMERDEMKEGLKTLREAQKKLFEARMKLMKNKFDEAVESAEEAAEIIADGTDSDDDDDDDEDEDDDDEDDEDDEEDDEEDDD